MPLSEPALRRRLRGGIAVFGYGVATQTGQPTLLRNSGDLGALIAVGI